MAAYSGTYPGPPNGCFHRAAPASDAQCAPPTAVGEVVTVPANAPLSHPNVSPIAGSVLPIRRAEELLATLPGVIAARIVASELGAVNEIHLLTTSEVTPKQTVRNVESALIAHLGMRVDHRKISVATTVETPTMRSNATKAAEEAAAAPPAPVVLPSVLTATTRRLYFEDVEVRR